MSVGTLTDSALSHDRLWQPPPNYHVRWAPCLFRRHELWC